ncbi:hypothetical protein GQ42DRAFT_80138 [Ramicandelaber brevisporus]|nr:hypothetical protein GQ42DRAFT_80138 [Ramicandelaber brevisporus]
MYFWSGRSKQQRTLRKAQTGTVVCGSVVQYVVLCVCACKRVRASGFRLLCGCDCARGYTLYMRCVAQSWSLLSCLLWAGWGRNVRVSLIVTAVGQ